MLPNPYLLRFRCFLRAGSSAAFVPLALAQAPPAAAARRACEIADIYRVLGVGNPAVAPGGARIAFAVRHTELEAGRSWSELWLCAGDGSGLRQMTTGHHGDTDPCFSPDGRTLLFVS
ncbi:MAG: hypothetical protein FJ265_19340, partial [Planctomycetes bacterium]|nr:hypothetical protein [Planctomycetota bacterium]